MKEITVTVLVDEAMKNALRELAKANDRSVGAEVRIAIREHLEKAAT